MTQTAHRIEELDPNFAQPRADKGTHWYDIRAFGIEGQGYPGEIERTYARLPAKARGVVRDPVWELGQHSAGLCVRFVTDSPTISAHWDLWSGNLAMNHRPASGVSGLDLYIKDPTRPPSRQYHWLGTGIPGQQAGNENVLVDGLDGAAHEFVLYLPLYNGVESVQVGVKEGATIRAAPRRIGKPVVMYGTSILHGGCAARPGMAYPAILGRAIDRAVINLGFSGNAKIEPEVAQLLAELDPSVYVLDYCPNNDAAGVAERTEPFVQTLRAAHPTTPIVMVENILPQKHLYVSTTAQGVAQKNAELRAAVERLREAGDAHLLYVPSEHLLGDDGEGTVDGVHPTDVGFQRLAAAVGPVVAGWV